jgi:hypothetical protein
MFLGDTGSPPSPLPLTSTHHGSALVTCAEITSKCTRYVSECVLVSVHGTAPIVYSMVWDRPAFKDVNDISFKCFPEMRNFFLSRVSSVW